MEIDVLATKEDLLLTRLEVKKFKVDMIKWMAGFWLAQMAAIIWLYLKG